MKPVVMVTESDHLLPRQGAIAFPHFHCDRLLLEFVPTRQLWYTLLTNR